MERFLASDTTEKEINHLLALKQRNDESLRQYASRYWALYNKIDGCDSKISARGFKQGLTPEYDQVYDDLARHKPHSMKELMQRTDEWVQLIESKAERGGTKSANKPSTPATPASGQIPSASRKQVNSISCPPPTPAPTQKRGPKPADFAAEKTVFNVPIYRLIDKIQDEPFFSFPNAKLGTENGRIKNERVRCSYHKEQGHFTTGCKPFKALLEQLVAAGHLRAYIDEQKTAARATRTDDQTEDDIPTIY